jgi:xylulokinase
MDSGGKVIASATEDHRAFSSPQIGWAEQAPEDWWRACGVAVRKALAQVGMNGDQIACVGFSGQMHGAVLLDKESQVVRPALIWCDVRTERQCRDLTDRIGAERLIHLTCNPALPNFTLTKCLWVRENEPENWSRVRSLLLPKDYVRFRLTGERAIDVADASGTLLLDVAHRRWSSELLDLVEMKETLLPRLYESQEICGSGSDCFKKRNAGGGGSGGSGGGSDRHGRGFFRHCERDDWNFGSGSGRDRPSRARLGRSGTHVLPRRAGALDCDGSDPGGWAFAALVPRSVRGKRQRSNGIL